MSFYENTLVAKQDLPKSELDKIKEKYSSKLVIAEQGGLWRADAQTIGFLNSFSDETLVVIDTFDNPVKVNRIELLESLTKTYTKIMTEWNSEWKELERKR